MLDSSIFIDIGVIEILGANTKINISEPPDSYWGQYMPPVVLAKNNKFIEDFTRDYHLNYYSEYCYDDNGIIWSEDHSTLIDFPKYWSGDMYYLPKNTRCIFRWAFNLSEIEHVVSENKVMFVGKSSGNDYSRLTSVDAVGYDKDFFIVEKGRNLLETVTSVDTVLEWCLNNKGKYAFISYSSKNQDKADATRMLLLEDHIACWMAPYDIPAGSKYAQVINDAIENCACLVLLLSNDSQNSSQVPREVERAVSCNKPIVTMQLENLKLNSEFKYYTSRGHIVAVQEIDSSSPEMKKVIEGIKCFTGTIED